jgi:two-component system sensor histidine kinase AlgZ
MQMPIPKLSFANLSNLLPANPWLRSIIINLILWGGILTFGAWGNYLDIVKSEKDLRFASMWMNWVENDFLLFVLSCVLYPLLGKYPFLVANAKNIARLFISLSIFFYPFHAVFLLFGKWKRFDSIRQRHNSFLDYVLNASNSGWFFCFAYFAAIVTAIIFVRIWHENRAQQDSINKIQTDNLKLNLALEQQKLQSLRQQLEPHFIFNALNAISALVRTNEKSVALSGIHRLSDLLRYALTASNKNWVSFKDELDFIRDYLALQQLRYGERLEVIIEGDTPAILHGDCLPLLLQPLIENALRHDLDCHEEQSQIRMQFHLNVDQVTTTIRNQMQASAVKNPGLGLGLSQTRLRLEMMYKGKASIQISETSDDFCVCITTPLHQPDSQL